MRVLIVYGSENDRPHLEAGREFFEREGISYREEVLSVHRDLDRVDTFLESLRGDEELGVVLAVAGLSAALPGVVASGLEVPVVGVPIAAGPLNGVDALLSVTQLPGGVPCTSVGIHRKAPLNACQFAARILRLCENGG